jgi:hypothetical protein
MKNKEVTAPKIFHNSPGIYRSLQSMATVKYLENAFLEILEIWYEVKSI